MRLQIGNRGYADRALRDERASCPGWLRHNVSPGRHRITVSDPVGAAEQAGGTHGTSVPFSKGCAQLVYRE
jgi:hypothetical protein